MDEKELINLLITERISSLLEKVPEEMKKRAGKTIDAMEEMGEKMEGDQRINFNEVLAKLAGDHAEEGQYLYFSGIIDGIKIAKYIYSI